MRNCCYCFNLKTGTIASALFVLITRTFLLISFAVILAYYHTKPETYWGQVDGIEEERPKVSILQFLINILIIKPGVIKSLGPAAVECLLFIIFSTILYFAVRQQNNKKLFWPWMVLMALEIAAEAVAAAVCLVTIEIYIALVPVILLVYILVFNCYLLHCVVTYYKIVTGMEPCAEPALHPSQLHISARRPLVHPPA